ncbi:MAG: ribosome silencing factor [Elusimicrobiota bacterium]|nr:ribosome silencing factor [Elusimicrobiota bacterium]
MTTSKSSFKKIAFAAARAGDSKKAHPVTIYDLAGKSPLADYAVLMVVESSPQLDAVEEEVQVRLKQEGIYCLHRDGMQSKNWKVLDYGGVLVHVYDGKAAEFYAIDKVYADFRTVEWEEKPEPKPAAPAVKTAPAREAAAKKPAVKKAAAKKPAAKKAPLKKTAVKKPAAKKPAAKKVPLRKTAKKSVAPKKAAKKAPVKKAKPAKKTAKKNSKKKWPSDGHSPLKRHLRKQ